ncbi:hypothetical protein ACLMAL_33530 [Nocardia sp. CWNU-33]|uniref:hypothetical protein n=1 Tax=Nocardia sp. CWNU-33 TaxID=3392117 RepID=UPI00398E5AFF
MSSDLVPSRPPEIAPSEQALLAQFHEETQQKLELAPADSTPLFQGVDGSLIRVVDDWVSDADAELGKADAITIQPTNVRDREVSEIGEKSCSTTFLD